MLGDVGSGHSRQREERKGPKDKHPHKEVLNLMAPAPRALRLPERS